MGRSPRFVYLSDATARTATLPGSVHRVGWRVIAANNRPLGRSVQVYRSYAECQAAVMRLRSEAAGLVSSVFFDNTSGLWSWSLTLAGESVAVCVHPYLRRVECVRALTQFVTALAQAAPSPEAVRYLGARALPAYGGPTTP